MAKIIDGHGTIRVKESAQVVVDLINNQNHDGIMIELTEQIKGEPNSRSVWINKYDIVRVFDAVETK